MKVGVDGYTATGSIVQSCYTLGDHPCSPLNKTFLLYLCCATWRSLPAITSDQSLRSGSRLV